MTDEKTIQMPSFRSISESQESRGLHLGRADSFDVSLRGLAMADALERVMQEERQRDRSSDEGDEDFDFAFVPRVSFGGFEVIDADQIFSQGQIRSQKLIRFGHLTRTSSSESSHSGEMDGVPAEIFCVWDPQSVPPSPRLRKKSSSTGTCSMRGLFLDLVSSRSRSDGKEKFISLSSTTDENSAKSFNSKKTETLAREQKKKKKSNTPSSRVRISKTDMGAAHRIFYVDRMAVPGDRRRTFLPYRQDLLGIFANPNGSPARSLFAL